MTAHRYDGMTVNERLFVAGLMSDFDRAVLARDVEALMGILRQLELSDENVTAIVERVLGPR